MRKRLFVILSLLALWLGMQAMTLVFKDNFDKVLNVSEANKASLSISAEAWGWSFDPYQSVFSRVSDNSLYCKKLDTRICEQGSQGRFINFDPNRDFTINLDVSWEDFGSGRYSKNKNLMAGLLFGGKSDTDDAYFLGVNYLGLAMPYSTKDAGGSYNSITGTKGSFSKFGPKDRKLTPLLEQSIHSGLISVQKPWKKLSVSRQANEIRFLIDEKVIHTMPAPNDMGSWIGIMMDGVQEPVFKNLEVWQEQLPKAEFPVFKILNTYDLSKALPNGWNDKNTDAGKLAEPSGYSISTVFSKERYLGSFPYSMNSVDDYRIDLLVSCPNVEPSRDAKTYGLMWKNTHNEIGGSFLISTAGNYVISYKKYFTNPSYDINLGGTNKLSLVKVHDRYYFLINEVLVAQRVAEGTHNFQVGFVQDKGLKVSYEKLSISRNNNFADFFYQTTMKKTLKDKDTLFQAKKPQKSSFQYTANGLECNTLKSKQEDYVSIPLKDISDRSFWIYAKVSFDDINQSGTTGFFIGDPRGEIQYFGISRSKWIMRRYALGKKNQPFGEIDYIENPKNLSHTLGLELRGKALRFRVDGKVIRTIDPYTGSLDEIGFLASENLKATFTDLNVYHSPKTPSMPLVWEDHFDKGEGAWQKASSTQCESSVENGVLMLNNVSGAYSGVWIDSQMDTTQDFCIEAELKWIECVHDFGIGIHFDFVDWNNFSACTISKDEKFTMIHRNKEQFYYMMPSLGDCVVDKDGSNHIKVWKKDKQIFLFINEVLVDSGVFNRVNGDFCGIVLAGKQKLSVDWFKVYGTKRSKQM